MGYARLYFPNDATKSTYEVIHDMVGVVCGNITSVNNLTTAWSNLSLITNTLNSNWTLLYPSATLGATANASRPSWVIRSPCVTASKFKYVRIAGHKQPISFSGNWPSYLIADRSYSTDVVNDSGICLTGGTNATNANTVVNESFVVTNINSAGDNDAQMAHKFRGNTFHLSWSQRHLLIWGHMVSGGNYDQQFVGFFEHTETPTSTWRSTAPFCALLFTSNTGKFGSRQTSNIYVSSGTTATPTDMKLRESLFLEFDHYNPVASTPSGVHNIFGNVGSLWTDMPITSNTSNCVPTVSTITSAGATAIYVQPLFYHQFNLGIPQIYISTLSNVYRVIGGAGSPGDTMTIGSNTFVYLPTSVSTYSIIVPYE